MNGLFLNGRRRGGWLGLLMCSLACTAQADSLALLPDRDNTLFERATGDLSNGAGPALFFGRTGPNANLVLRRALVRFDLTSIPPGSVIRQASLVINVDMVPPAALAFDAALHRMQSDWGEAGSFAPGAGGGGAPAQSGDATWLHRFYDNVFWTGPGGDFEPAPSATAAINGAIGPFRFASGTDLIADVQGWVDQPSSNFGWVMIGDEGTAQNARRIASRENPALAPVLEIEFEPAPLLPDARPVPLANPWSALLMAALLLLAALLRMDTLRGRA